MVRRSLLVVGLLAVVFSAQAELMLYTFTGGVTRNTSLSSEFKAGDPITYQFLLDFDSPGVLFNSPCYDETRTSYYEGFTSTVTVDYASAKLVDNSTSIFFPTDNLFVSNMATAWHTETVDAFTAGGTSTLGYNTLLIENQYGLSGYHTLRLNNLLESSFQIGDDFSFYEIESVNNSPQGSHYYKAEGFLTLASITTPGVPPVSSVPEPSTMVLLSGSLIALSGFGLKRKR